MAIYHLNVGYVSRSTGRSAVQSVAYIMGLAVYEGRRGLAVNYTNRKDDILFSFTLAPEQAGEDFRSPRMVWNLFEDFEDIMAEKRFTTLEGQDRYKSSARTAQTMVVALPKELSPAVCEELLRDFAEELYVSRGLVVSCAAHKDEGNPHAHLIVSTRSVLEGDRINEYKDRGLTKIDFLLKARQLWAYRANSYLEREGFEERITEKSFADLGITLLPSKHRGWMADKRVEKGEPSRIVQENEDIRRENREALLETPDALLVELTHTKATFTQLDLLKAIQKRVGDDDALTASVFEKALQASIVVGEGMNGMTRYTSASYQRQEEEAVALTQKLATQTYPQRVTERHLKRAFAHSDVDLSEEQRQAIRGLVGPQQLAVLGGGAGTGKTTVLKGVVEVYERTGHTVIGTSLAALAADTLGTEARIKSHTLHSWLYKWQRYEEAQQKFLSFNNILTEGLLKQLEWYQDLKQFEGSALTSKHVLIVDEASMIGTRQWHALQRSIANSGAKLIAVGDDSQFKPIEAGDFFREILDHAQEAGSLYHLTEIHRQKVGWMREASVTLAQLHIQEALKAYEHHGHLHSLSQTEMVSQIAQTYGEKIQMPVPPTPENQPSLSGGQRLAEHRPGGPSLGHGLEGQGIVRQKLASQSLERQGTGTQSEKQSETQPEMQKGLVLAYTNQQCHDLNTAIRQKLRDSGLLVEEDALTLQGKGFALGDTIVFLKNDKKHIQIIDQDGVVQEKIFIRNGTRGVLKKVTRSDPQNPQAGWRVEVELEGKGLKSLATFHTDTYDALDHGYAVTMHKAQGQTVDFTLVAASRFMDAKALYVALTRHRYDVQLYYAPEEFASFKELATRLSRFDHKDLVKDYTIHPVHEEAFQRVQAYKLAALDAAAILKEGNRGNRENIGKTGNTGTFGKGGGTGGAERAIDWEAYQEIKTEQKQLGREILDDFTNHKLYVHQSNLTEEGLRIAVGLKPRPLSRSEETAFKRVELYTETALAARTLFNTIKETHPGFECTQHAEYPTFEGLRSERDALAQEIMAHEPLHRDFIKTIAETMGYGRGVLQKQADAHAVRQSQAPRLEHIRALIQDWKTLSGTLSETWAGTPSEGLAETWAGGTLSKGEGEAETEAKAQVIIPPRNTPFDRLQEGFDEGFCQRGQVASQLVAMHLEEKTANQPRLTYPKIMQAGLSYLELLHEARDYERFAFAMSFQEESLREIALGVVAYSQAKQVTASLYRQCLAEVKVLTQEHEQQQALQKEQDQHKDHQKDPQHGKDPQKDEQKGQQQGQQKPLPQTPFEDKPKPVFWHAASYEAYIQAASVCNERAYALTTQGRGLEGKASVKAFADVMGISIPDLSRHSHQGELQDLCRQFKRTDSVLVKGMIAAELTDWLVLDKSLGGIAGGRTTYQTMTREQLDWADVNKSLRVYDRLMFKAPLTPSQEALSEAVFVYTDQRRGVGKAFAKITQFIEEQTKQAQEKGQKTLPLLPWQTGDLWKAYLEVRKTLDASAFQIVQADSKDQEPFLETFPLNPSVLKRQAQRHTFEEAYQKTRNGEVSQGERAEAFMLLDAAQNDSFDKILKSLWSGLNSGGRDPADRDLTGRNPPGQDPSFQTASAQDLLKSYRTFRRVDARSCVSQNEETLTAFASRREAFLETFRHQDPEGYRSTLLACEAQEQAYQLQQAKVLENLKQKVGIEGESPRLSLGLVQGKEGQGKENAAPFPSATQSRNPSSRHSLHSRSPARDTISTLERSWQHLKDASVPEQGPPPDNFQNPPSLYLKGRGTPYLKPDTRNLKPDTALIKEHLNSRIKELAFELLGKPATQTAREWRYGKKGSISIQVAGSKQGLYSNFEEGTHGSALKLIQEHFGFDHKQAFKWGVEWLGKSDDLTYTTPKGRPSPSIDKGREEPEWQPLFPAPTQFPNLKSEKQLAYMLRGRQEIGRFTYKDADENILGYVVRLEDRHGDKMTPTLTYCRNEKGDHQWRWKGFGEDRPLYGLEQLAQKPDARVLVVEGEKTAEAAKALFPDYAVVTWSGGCGAVSKSDWSVLKDRTVVIWPDHDKPGNEAAHKIVEILKTHNNHTPHSVDLPSTLPEKWDLADKLPEGWDYDTVRSMMSGGQADLNRPFLDSADSEREDSIRAYLREEVRLDKHFWLDPGQVSYFLKDLDKDPYEALRKWQYVSEDDSFKPMTQAERHLQESQTQQFSAPAKTYHPPEGLQSLQSRQGLGQGEESIQQAQRPVQAQQEKQRDADAVRFMVLSRQYQELYQERPSALTSSRIKDVEKAMKDIAAAYEKDNTFAKTLERFGDRALQKVALDFLKEHSLKRGQNQLTFSYDRSL